MMWMKFGISLGKGFFPLLFSSFLMVLCLVGCAQDSNILDNGQNRQLEFSVTTHRWDNSDKSSDQKIPSRATPISTFDTSKNFNVIADVNNEGNWTTEVNNEMVSYSSANNIWKTTAIHYWPGTGSTVNFYAYYPTGISGSITHAAGSAPVLSYTVPDNAADQIDILASSKTGLAGDSYSQTPVDFEHIFAVVQFSVGSSGLPSGTITKVTLNNILYKGTYSLGGTWTPNTTEKKSFSQTVSASTNAGTVITPGVMTFMMMPQTLSNDASITVTYSNGGILTKAITGIWEAGKTYTYNLSYPPRTFNYTGSAQSYIVPVTGIYKVECWGASASGLDNLYYNSGRGGYSMGYITLTQGMTLYIYVGQEGGAFNGGGQGETSGGGATDVRLISNTWKDFNSLKSRIMVAGGGGGGYYSSTTKDGICPDAGGLKGTDAYCVYIPDGGTGYSGHGGTQTSGGKCGTSSTFDPYTPNADGHFGFGGIGNSYNNGFGNMSSGGGGGYYGGGHGVHPGNGWTGGGGGSSFISGYPGCNAISESSTSTNIIHTGSPNHYSGYVFTNMQMIAGDSLIPSPSGGTETGHTGNGYARITFISAD
jgi:hypothetical protein